MDFVSQDLSILGQPKTDESAPRKPSVGLRHYIPLFFLAPSMLLLVHAWNRTRPPAPRVFVVIDAGGFEFPRDVQLEVRVRDGVRAPVEGGQASFPVPLQGPVEVALFVTRPDRPAGVAVGSPTRFALAADGAPRRWTLRVAPADCAGALHRLRAPH